MLVWIVVFLSFGLFIAAAKTHGRQLRLERELRGHDEVQFGTGTNPPWVEALWRRDRIRFWSLTFVLMAIVGVLTHFAAPIGDDLPLARMTENDRLTFGLTGGLLWAPTVTFLTLAVFSQARLARDRSGPDVKPRPPAWAHDAARGTLFWFGLCGLLALTVMLLASR